MTDYYRYTRDYWIPTLFNQFFIWTIWGLAMAATIYFFVYYTMGGAISSDGRTNDFWNSGVVCYTVNVMVHHVMMFAETREYNIIIIGSYFLSLGMFYLVINMNNVYSISVYQGNQFEMIFSSPITWIEVFLLCFIIYIPRHIHKAFQHVIWHPEFIKIKGN